MSGLMNILFDIELRHSYFESGQGGNALKVVPTKDTAVQLKRIGMGYRMTTNGIQVYYPAQRAADFLYYLDLPSAQRILNFQLLPLDGLFYNYTALNYPGNGFLLAYLSSNAEDDGILMPQGLLSDGFLAFAQSIELKDGQELKDPAGEILPKSANGKYNLPTLGEGLFEIIEGTEIANRVVSFDKGMQQLPLALISVQLGDDMIRQSLSEASKNESTSPITYTIAFEARETTWRYYLNTDDSHRDLNQYTVVGSEQVAFKRVSQDPYHIFESSKPIPIKEHYHHSFSLRNGKAGKALIERLPGAGTTIIFPEQTQESSKVYS